MIRIIVKNKELVLDHNTTMTVELNNALFASPDIEGDISFSFTLPVDGNERVLDFAHLPQTGKLKKLPCQVYCNGGFNWSGQLVLQKSSRDNITAALVINPYPEGFSETKLTDNKDEEIVISQSREAHEQAWKDFLSASINNEDVKFAPLYNEEGYGSDNEDYGFWKGKSRRKIVNELFFDPDGTLIDAAGSLFSKAHNERFELDDGDDSVHIEMNQLAFCPQIRIARILEIWCRNAGYKFVNHLGEDINGTYLQSMKSLDGTIAQYAISEMVFAAYANVTLTSQYNHYYKLEGDSAYLQNGMINIPLSGWWRMTVSIRFKQATNLGAVHLVVMQENANESDGEGVISQNIMLCNFEGNNIYTAGGSFNIYLPPAAVTTPIKLICRKGNGNPVPLIDWEVGGYTKELGFNVTVRKISSDQEQIGFNIFRSKFNIPELLPDITNSAFLRTMLETMGMCYFVTAKTKTIEIVPYAMLKKSKSLDLSDYELTRETGISEQEETLRTFRLKPMKDEEYNEDLRLEDVDVKLPDAYSNHEHLVLRTRTNTLYRAEREETESESNWVEGWKEYCGNPDRLEVGEGDEENREPSVLIPHQRLFSMSRRRPDTDTLSGQTPQLMVADFAVSSDLYNTAEKPSDIILTQYRGFRQRSREASTSHPSPCNEVMLPVWNDEFSLTAKGRNSLGEKYVKPVLELFGHKTVTYKFRLPANMIQAVEDTLRPSVLPPEMQTRYIIVRNVKSVPKKITIQIDNDIDDTVLCQIEAVKAY